VTASVILDRLNPYLWYPADSDYQFFLHPEAVYGMCCVLLAYKKAHSDFYNHFPDDEELIVELAMAGEAVTSLLRFLNNGQLPNLIRLCSATPHIVALCESLRRKEMLMPGVGID